MLKYFICMQDVGVCYAFVEFEDMTSVHNAVKVWIYFKNLPKNISLILVVILFSMESVFCNTKHSFR